MLRTFRPHQTEAFEYASARDTIALFMEMRLGKSMVFTRWAKLKATGPVLIVTPTTTIPVWQRELTLEGIASTALVGPTAKKIKTYEAALNCPFDGDDWFLINPEGLRAWPAICKLQDWSVVGLDETGGWLTNPSSQISKTVRRSLGAVPHRAILTGLPDPNGATDYVEQCLFAFGSFMGHANFWTWRRQYMRPGFHAWELKPGSRRKIKKAVRKVAFRKTAKQAGCYVPNTYSVRKVELPPKLRKLYREVNKDFTCGPESTKWVVVAENWLSQIAGGSIPGGGFDPFKVREVVRLLTSELRRKPVVIWARFVKEVKAINAALKKAGVRCRRITGLTKFAERPAIVEQFRQGELDAVVMQGRIGKYALDLSFADVQIFYSNSYDFDERGQLEKRTAGVLKKASTLILDIVTEGTIDEAVVDVLKSKKKSAKDFASRLHARAKALGVAK